MGRALLSLLLVGLCGPLRAQALDPVAPARLQEGMVVELALVEPISSSTARIDQMFQIRLASPVMRDGVALLPAGLTGEGQVVHAAKAKALGRGGELILAARYLSCGDIRIALRGFRLSGAGSDNSALIVGAGAAAGVIAAPLLFIKGGNVAIAAGAQGSAKLAASMQLASPCAQEPVQP